MLYRTVDLLSRKNVGDSGTETVDLDVTDPITELTVVHELTNGAAAAEDANIQDNVTKIEVVDGGTVYASLSGPVAFGQFFYEAGHMPPHEMSERLSESQRINFPIRFGRYLGDPLRNLDVTKLRNPQIKVTWSKNSLHLASSLYLTVRAKLLQDVPGAANALLTKEVRSFTTASSGDEDTELPTDYPIRRLFVRGYKKNATPSGTLTNFKLDCDEGRFIAFDLSGWNLQRDLEAIFGYANIRQYIHAEAGDRKQTYLGCAWAGSAALDDSAYYVDFWCSRNPYGIIHGAKHDNTALQDKKVEINVVGSLPCNLYCIPFGLPEDPATWFPAPAYRKIKLRLTQAEASGTATILVQQDRPL